MPSPTTPLSGRRLAELSTARLTVILEIGRAHV